MKKNYVKQPNYLDNKEQTHCVPSRRRFMRREHTNFLCVYILQRMNVHSDLFKVVLIIAIMPALGELYHPILFTEL